MIGIKFQNCSFIINFIQIKLDLGKSLNQQNNNKEIQRTNVGHITMFRKKLDKKCNFEPFCVLREDV